MVKIFLSPIGLSLKEHLEKNTKFPEEVAKIILK